jgi:hypothetical protein
VSKSTNDQLSDAEERIDILTAALEAIANDACERPGNRSEGHLLRDIADCANKALTESEEVVS